MNQESEMNQEELRQRARELGAAADAYADMWATFYLRLVSDGVLPDQALAMTVAGITAWVVETNRR